METQFIDGLFPELSQITNATTNKELLLQKRISKLQNLVLKISGTKCSGEFCKECPLSKCNECFDPITQLSVKGE